VELVTITMHLIILTYFSTTTAELQHSIKKSSLSCYMNEEVLLIKTEWTWKNKLHLGLSTKQRKIYIWKNH